jgi:putative ABC transport system ATP-binding protein
MKMETLIAATQVTKTVAAPDGSELHILTGVDIAVNSHEALALLGTSGSGKSTLLGLLAALDLPTAGEIELLGQNTRGMTEDQRARLRLGQVGFVFQSFQLIPGMTALENVALPMKLAGQKHHLAAARELLADVGLEERMQHHAKQLSGGEQQRVALARAFAGDPRLLFADEPTGNLDEETGRHIIDLMFALRDRCGTALLLVTHDRMLAERCNRICHLEGGKIRERRP